MKKVLILLALSIVPMAAQNFGAGNARRIQSITVKSPLNCSDGYILTYVAANLDFECLVNSGAAGTGISSLNALTAGTQTFAIGTTGTDFGIVSSTSTHTFNLPSASASNRGLLLAADWTTFNAKAGLGISNTWTTGAQSFAAATSFILPVSAGYAPTANGSIGYDSTANLYKFGFNGTNKIMAVFSGAFADNDCLKYQASTNTIITAGAACGSGGGTISFTGDGVLISNSGSASPVTVTLATAAAHKVWMNNTGSTAAPGYQSLGTADLPAAVVYNNASNAYTTGTQDFSAASHTLPALKGTIAGKPATCTVGELYFATDATAGQNIYECAATNTWTQQLNSGGTGGTGNAAAGVTTTFSATPTFTCPSSSAGTEVSFVLSTALSANVTASTLSGCTNFSQLNFRFTQAASTTAFTVAMPTGFSAACQVSPIFSSNTNMSFIWDGTTARLIACSVDAGPSVGLEQAAPSQTPASGAPFSWFDSTSHFLRMTNSGSTIYQMSKELSSGNVRCAGGANAADANCSAAQLLTDLGVVPEANGGTGANNTPGAAGHVLRSNATHYVDSAILAADIPVIPTTTGTSVTLTGSNQYFVCTGTCTVTVPVPAAGVQYCVFNDDNVATVITLSAIGSSARYENTARTAYGTAGTGTFVSGGAAGDKVCIIGRDATHYLTMSFNGTWTAN